MNFLEYTNTRPFHNGLVVGKFCPLHRGHEHVINTALSMCHNVMIISYTSQDLGFDHVMRERWLTSRFPTAAVILIPPELAPMDEADDSVHRSFCGGVCAREGFLVDAVFTSESYGPGFAESLSKQLNRHVTHVSVDPLREKFPISGTVLRTTRATCRPEWSTLWDEFVHPDIRSST